LLPLPEEKAHLGRLGREGNWREFIKRHMHNTVAAGPFTVEVVAPYALVTFHPKRRALRGDGDGDGKFYPALDHIIESAGVELVPLPPKSPDLNAHAERLVLTVKSECMRRLLVFDEGGP
jgi:hypothetical protein